MRSKYFICVFFLLFGVNMLIGQSLDSILKIKKYSSIELLLDDEIDLCVMDDNQINNREDAMIRIRSFLDRYNISDIETLHKGTSNSSGSRYYVFKMNTNSGPIRAFVYYESKNKKEYIKELRFDTF